MRGAAGLALTLRRGPFHDVRGRVVWLIACTLSHPLVGLGRRGCDRIPSAAVIYVLKIYSSAPMPRGR